MTDHAQREALIARVAEAIEQHERWPGPGPMLNLLRDCLAALRASAPPAPEGDTLSLSIERDPLAVSTLLDDSTREREMYHRLVADIRKVLGDDGLHAQLLDLPKVIAAALRRAAPAVGEAPHTARTAIGEPPTGMREVPGTPGLYEAGADLDARETAESAADVLRHLVEHGAWYVSAIELDGVQDGDDLLVRASAALDRVKEGQ